MLDSHLLPVRAVLYEISRIRRTKVMGPKVKSILLSVAVLFAILLGTPQKASAYVDPGSGAMLWQAFAALLLGLMFYIRRIRTWFGRLFNSTVRSESKDRLTSD
jgi:hypothetical protein